MTAEQEVVIASPTVEPFSEQNLYACRSCGHAITGWQRFVSVIKGGYASMTRTRYCAGGKGLVEIKTGIQAVMSGETEVVNDCAGITMPHLHARCEHCGFQFLMATNKPIQVGH